MAPDTIIYKELTKDLVEQIKAVFVKHGSIGDINGKYSFYTTAMAVSNPRYLIIKVHGNTIYDLTFWSVHPNITSYKLVRYDRSIKFIKLNCDDIHFDKPVIFNLVGAIERILFPTKKESAEGTSWYCTISCKDYMDLINTQLIQMTSHAVTPQIDFNKIYYLRFNVSSNGVIDPSTLRIHKITDPNDDKSKEFIKDSVELIPEVLNELSESNKDNQLVKFLNNLLHPNTILTKEDIKYIPNGSYGISINKYQSSQIIDALKDTKLFFRDSGGPHKTLVLKLLNNIVTSAELGDSIYVHPLTSKVLLSCFQTPPVIKLQDILFPNITNQLNQKQNGNKNQLQGEETPDGRSSEGCVLYGRRNKFEYSAGRHCDQASAQNQAVRARRYQVILSTRSPEAHQYKM